MRLITLTSDFGLDDWFVGTMKGVILDLAPEARIVDLTHAVRPRDVRGAAFALMAACGAFPRGTIHVAVVDPGVGSERAAVAVRTANAVFLGPDNGVLSYALRCQPPLEIRQLTNARLWRQPVSRTFHGRDVFAPVAAFLAGGGRFRRVGLPRGDLTRLAWPEPRPTARGHTGEIIYTDRFGNALTNLPAEGLLDWEQAADWRLQLPRHRTCPLGLFYQSVRPGAAVAVPGSSGWIEIATNGGQAASELALRVGDPVRLRRQRR